MSQKTKFETISETGNIDGLKGLVSDRSEASAPASEEWVLPDEGDIFLLRDASSPATAERSSFTLPEFGAGSLTYETAHGSEVDVLGVIFDGTNHFLRTGVTTGTDKSWQLENLDFVVGLKFRCTAAGILADFGNSNGGAEAGFTVQITSTILRINITDNTLTRHRQDYTHGGSIINDGLDHTVLFIGDRSADDVVIVFDGVTVSSTRAFSALSALGTIDASAGSKGYSIGDRENSDTPFTGIIYSVAIAKNTLTYDGTNQ